MTTQVRNSEMVNLLRGDYQARYEPQKALYSIMSLMQALPGLRGFWPMSSFDENGNAYDLSEQNRTLTYNGNPTYNYDNLAPYLDFDGTGDYLSRADEAGLDILGTETYVANPGLTLGGWFWADDATPVANQVLMSKWNSAANLSYLMHLLTTGFVQGAISNTGAASAGAVTSSVSLSDATWFFAVFRFDPSTETAIFVNGTKDTNTTSIPASIFNGNAAFAIGERFSAGAPVGATLDGRASLCFLCAAALSDAIIGNLFQQSRALFGV